MRGWRRDQSAGPMTLGNAAAAQVRLIVWCQVCGHQAELDPAVQAAACGADTPVPEWGALRCIRGQRGAAIRPSISIWRHQRRPEHCPPPRSRDSVARTRYGPITLAAILLWPPRSPTPTRAPKGRRSWGLRPLAAVVPTSLSAIASAVGPLLHRSKPFAFPPELWFHT
jgi:hypothetical protein